MYFQASSLDFDDVLNLQNVVSILINVESGKFCKHEEIV